MMKKVCVLALLVVLAGCRHKNTEANLTAALAAEPDRVLYDQALKDLQKSRFNIARLTLQTLVNTYPDSEYLPQSKYALAESFYKEGGSANLSQAAIEFKDFITFFPVDAKASDAQMMIAMTYIRQMQKPDRDNSQAKLAEMELTRMIENYPDSPLLDEAKAKLRGVEEVLAEGEFKVGSLYLVKKSYPAAISRFKTVIEKYPDFAGTPEVLFSLGEALRGSNNEPESAIYYSRIVSEHPYSARVPIAKLRLTDLKMAIPDADPAALARGAGQEQVERGFFARMVGGMVTGSPVSTDTAAASVVDSASQPSTDRADPGSVNGVSGSSGGSSNTGGSNSNGNNGSGTFSLDPKVAQPAPTQKKPH